MQLDAGTGFGIATHAGGAEMEGKTAEAANFNATTAGQGIGHLLDQGLDCQLHILGGQLRLPVGNALNQF